MDECCHPKTAVKVKWYRNKTLLITAGIVILLIGSYWFDWLVPFRTSFIHYARIILIPVLIGFFLGGVIDYYVPREYISKHLAQKRKRTIFYSAVLGLFMSACSHGILALSIELHKKGASGPAVISFLLASPWANLPVTLLLIGFFGWNGFLIILAALFVAISTGLLFQILDAHHLIEHNRHTVTTASSFSVRKDILRRIQGYKLTVPGLKKDISGIAKGIYELSEMILWWLLIGMVLASLASAYVPSEVFSKYLGPSLFGLFMTMALATVLEVCSEGTAPLAFEIYKQTGAFGNAFVFLMGGVVTDYTEIGLVWASLGKRTALWMLAVTLPQVILIGWLFNQMLF